MNFNIPFTHNSELPSTNYLQPLLASLQPQPTENPSGTLSMSMFELPGEPENRIQTFFKRQISNPDKFEIYNSFDIYGNQLNNENNELDLFDKEESKSDDMSKENSSVGPVQENQENTNPWTNVATPMKNARHPGLSSNRGMRHLGMSRSPLVNITPTIAFSEQKDQKIERVLLYNSISGEKSHKKKKAAPAIKNFR